METIHAFRYTYIINDMVSILLIVIDFDPVNILDWLTSNSRQIMFLLVIRFLILLNNYQRTPTTPTTSPDFLMVTSPMTWTSPKNFSVLFILVDFEFKLLCKLLNSILLLVL